MVMVMVMAYQVMKAAPASAFHISILRAASPPPKRIPPWTKKGAARRPQDPAPACTATASRGSSIWKSFFQKKSSKVTLKDNIILEKKT